MRLTKIFLSSCILILLAGFLVGCGSGDASSQNDSTRGTLQLVFQFPASLSVSSKKTSRAFSGIIPLGTRSILVTLIDPLTKAQIDQRLVTSPVDSTGALPPAVTVVFNSLPAGPIHVDAVAHPDAKGSQNPIGIGSADGQIFTSGFTNLNVTFALTFKSLQVTPDILSLTPLTTAANHSGAAHANVLDTADRPINLPVYWLSTDPTIATVSFDPNNPNAATITGIAEGMTTVIGVEPNSGITGTVHVLVSFQNTGNMTPEPGAITWILALALVGVAWKLHRMRRFRKI